MSSDVIQASKADIDIYDSDIDMYLQEYLDTIQVKDVSKLLSTQWAGAMMYIHKHVFSRDPMYLYTKTIDHGYILDICKVYMLVKKYIYLCNMYGQRVCISHFCYLTGISPNTVYDWKNDKTRVSIDYIRDNSTGIDKGDILTVSRQDIYKTLIHGTVVSSEDILLSKHGINSVVYFNTVQERHVKNSSVSDSNFDVSGVADQLGIAKDVELLESKG